MLLPKCHIVSQNRKQILLTGPPQIGYGKFNLLGFLKLGTKIMFDYHLR